MKPLNFLRTDRSAKSGLFLGAIAIGSSFQPGLLTRASKDQTIATAASGLVGYVVGTAGSAVVDSLRSHLPQGMSKGLDTALVVSGGATIYATRPEEHETKERALIRLAGISAATIGTANLVTSTVNAISGNKSTATQFLLTNGSAAAIAGATYLALRPKRQSVGSLQGDGTLMEDSKKEVNPAESMALTVAATGALIGLSHFESYTVSSIARGVARVVGGSEEDHRTVARVGSIVANALVARMVMSKLTGVMTRSGKAMELAHLDPPTIKEVTGCTESGADWRSMSREGRRWLTMALTPDKISKIMGGEAKQPIRAYASLESGDDDFARAAYLLSELERTNAYDRSILALFSPTGSGYINYVATETLEYLTNGDCASMGIEYSVLPSSMSLTAVPLGSRQTRLVIDGVIEKLLSLPVEKRPKFVMFGESLGAQVSQDVFTDQGVDGPKSAGIEAGIWIGTPNATKWRRQLWGDRSVFEEPSIGPDRAYLPRATAEWLNKPIAEQRNVQYLLLQNGDDPVPKFGSELFWQEPPWLYMHRERPPGSPKGTRWVPFVTGLQTFIDLINALSPTPGIFMEGGHDYRLVIPSAIKAVYGLDCSDEQGAVIAQALREREFGWELARRWLEAGRKTDPEKREKALTKVRKTATRWVDRDPKTDLLSDEEIEALLDKNWW